jgi:hypothetical protein
VPRPTLTGWPTGLEPHRSEVFTHNEVVVAATPERVWDLLVDAQRWPDWYRNAHRVRLPRGRPRLDAGTVFTWITFVVPLTSTVVDFEPRERLGWTFKGPGIRGYHGWLLRPSGEGTLVVTEETQRGLLPRLLWPVLKPVLWLGHQYWLRRLSKVV